MGRTAAAAGVTGDGFTIPRAGAEVAEAGTFDFPLVLPLAGARSTLVASEGVNSVTLWTGVSFRAVEVALGFNGWSSCRGVDGAPLALGLGLGRPPNTPLQEGKSQSRWAIYANSYTALESPGKGRKSLPT